MSIFTMDFSTVWTGVLSRTARRIGLGLCGRVRSGTRIPEKTRNNGIIRIMKRIHPLCFANILIVPTYQTIWFNASWLTDNTFMIQVKSICLECLFASHPCPSLFFISSTLPPFVRRYSTESIIDRIMYIPRPFSFKLPESKLGLGIVLRSKPLPVS